MGMNAEGPLYDSCFSQLFSLPPSVTFLVVVLCKVEFFHLAGLKMHMEIYENCFLIIFKA